MFLSANKYVFCRTMIKNIYGTYIGTEKLGSVPFFIGITLGMATSMVYFIKNHINFSTANNPARIFIRLC